MPAFAFGIRNYLSNICGMFLIYSLTAKSVVRYAAFIVLTAVKTNSNTKNPRPAKRGEDFCCGRIKCNCRSVVDCNMPYYFALETTTKLREQIFSVINRTLEKHNKVDRIVCDLTYSFYFSIV